MIFCWAFTKPCASKFWLLFVMINLQLLGWLKQVCGFLLLDLPIRWTRAVYPPLLLVFKAKAIVVFILFAESLHVLVSLSNKPARELIVMYLGSGFHFTRDSSTWGESSLVLLVLFFIPLSQVKLNVRQETEQL